MACIGPPRVLQFVIWWRVSSVRGPKARVAHQRWISVPANLMPEDDFEFFNIGVAGVHDPEAGGELRSAAFSSGN